MRELIYVPNVILPEDVEGARGLKERLGAEGSLQFVETARAYTSLTNKRLSSLILKRGFNIYCENTPTSESPLGVLSRFAAEAAHNHPEAKIILKLVQRGGRIVPIDSVELMLRIIEISKAGATDEISDGVLDSIDLSEHWKTERQIGIYRASIISGSLRDGQQGIFFEDGEGCTLNYLPEDIVINHLITPEEYREYARKQL